MTLGQIMRFALLQLGEDEADIEEYADLFRMYANEAYTELLQRYMKPKETITLRTDEAGCAFLDGYGIRHIVSARRKTDRAMIPFVVSDDGAQIKTGVRGGEVELICEVECPMLREDTDEPKLPEYAHAALVEYICYRHLNNGNLAKQSRAQAHLNRYYQIAGTIRPQGYESVRAMRNLYAATDIRS